MSSAEHLNFSVGAGNPNKKQKKRPPCNLKVLTLEKLHNWIDNLSIDDLLKIELKKSCSAYPQQALPFWQKNYSKHLSAAQNLLQNKKPIPKSEKPQKENHVEEKEIRSADTGVETRSFEEVFDAGWISPSENQS